MLREFLFVERLLRMLIGLLGLVLAALVATSVAPDLRAYVVAALRRLHG